MYLYLHDVSRELGPIELVPASQPWNTHDLPATSPELCARPEAGGLDCRGLGDAGARRYAASGLPFHAERLRADGDRHFARKRYANAEASYSAALALEAPNARANAALWYNRAACHQHLGQPRLAHRDALLAAEAEPVLN